MPENVSLLELGNNACGSQYINMLSTHVGFFQKNLTMVEMQVTPANCAAGDFQNDITVIDDFWFGRVNLNREFH